MGMGCVAAYADVITEDDVKEFCPNEFQSFVKTIEDENKDIDEVARGAEYEDIDNEKVVEAYNKLLEAFQNKTGLTLGLAYHSVDDGDIYDEIDGRYWYVNGMYQLTPAGEKMRDYVERKNFVQYG
jgi:hypothetical protein